MKITKGEIEGVSRLDAFNRYKYFIKRIVDFKKIYTLIDNGDLAVAEVKGQKVISVWSAKEFAELCIIEEWTNYKVEQINLNTFLKDYSKLVKENGYLINVFSIESKSGFVVEWDELTRDINEEKKSYK